MRKRVVFLMLILSICLIFATGCFDDVSYLTIRFDSNNGTQITELQVRNIMFSTAGITEIPSGYLKPIRLKKI